MFNSGQEFTLQSFVNYVFGVKQKSIFKDGDVQFNVHNEIHFRNTLSLFLRVN